MDYGLQGIDAAIKRLRFVKIGTGGARVRVDNDPTGAAAKAVTTWAARRGIALGDLARSLFDPADTRDRRRRREVAALINRKG